MGDIQREVERIRSVYAKRRAHEDRYSPFLPFNSCLVQERNRVLVDMLRGAGYTTLAGLNILEAGCGRGALSRFLMELGAEPRKLFGIDVVNESLTGAAQLNPNLHFICASAVAMPFPNEVFDLVFQFTLFTSILDAGAKKAAAREILRVLRPQGKLIWYDFHYNNPRNPDVRGIGSREIGLLFPECHINRRRVTLAPPIGRVIAPLSAQIYGLLSGLRIFCSHYMCVIEKNGSGPLAT